MLLNNASFTEIRSLRSPFASIGTPESANAPTNPYLPAVQKAQVGYAEASVHRSPKDVDRLQLHRYGTFTFGCYP